MEKAYLAVNHFLKGEKFTTLYKHLCGAAKKEGISLCVKTNLELALCKNFEKVSFTLFWDKDTVLARRLERAGIPVFNSARAIEICDDKAKTYTELLGTVPQPKTMCAPLTYKKEDLTPFIEGAVMELGLPLVFKSCCGSFGQQVYLCESIDDIKLHITGEKPFILQEYISCSAGHDLRLQVVGNKVVAAVRRENKKDFRANATLGGKMEAYTPTKAEEEMALTASAKLGLLFSGVDILEGAEGPLLCEVNSNAHIMNLLDATGVDAAPLIFRAIEEKLWAVS